MSDQLTICAYTGAPLEIVYSPGAGYTTRGGFDPAAWQDEMALRETLRLRNGVRKRRELRCAYMGQEVTIVRSGGRARADGALSPRRLWKDKLALRYDLAFREGVPPPFPREVCVVVGEELQPVSDPREGIAEGIAQAKDAVEALLLGGD